MEVKRFKIYAAGGDLFRWLVNSGGVVRCELKVLSSGSDSGCLQEGDLSLAHQWLPEYVRRTVQHLTLYERQTDAHPQRPPTATKSNSGAKKIIQHPEATTSKTS